MPVAVTYKRTVAVAVATDTDFANTVADRSRTITDSTTEAATTFQRKLVASENIRIDLGDITTLKALAVEFSAAVNLRIGAADNDPVPLKPVSEGQIGFALLELETAAGIWLENVSDTAAVSVTLVAIGNA